MSNGNMPPRRPGRPEIKPVPVDFPREIKTPRGILEQDRDDMGRRARNAAIIHPDAGKLDDLEKQAQYLVYSLPEAEIPANRDFIVMKVQEIRRLLFFLNKARQSSEGIDLAPFARRNVKKDKDTLGWQMMLVTFSYFEKILELIDEIERGLCEKGLSYVFSNEGDGVRFSEDYMRLIRRIGEMRFQKLEEEMVGLMKMVQNLFETKGLAMTEDRFERALFHVLEKSAQIDPIYPEQEATVTNNRAQYDNLQRYVDTISNRPSYGGNNEVYAELLGEGIENMEDRLLDNGDYLRVLGLRQMVYEKYKKGFGGEEVWTSLCAINNYLLQSYFIRYYKWLLDHNHQEEDDIQT